MNDIFLSYNREDAATAKRFADGFAAEGLSVWWDIALRSGEAYDEVTEAALRGAKAVVVLWSPRSVVSRWVRAEATIADRCKTLVPVMIEPCERPIMFELTQTAELGHWTGDAMDKAWQALVGDVRGFVGRGAGLTPVPAAARAPAAPPVARDQQGKLASIAVLPFRNRSGRAEDDVFALGMAEDLVEALSTAVNVSVISASVVLQHTTGNSNGFNDLVRATGVRYVLEGNVRRAGDRLRVTSQLISAANGEILWTRKFERNLAEISVLQEELVIDLAQHLNVQVYRIEMARTLKKPDNLTAWECVIRGMAAYHRRVPGKYLLDAIAEGEHAVALAPDFGMAHAMLASAKSTAYMMMSPDDPTEVARIRQHITRALELDHQNALVLAHAANGYCLIGEPHEGRALARHAVAMRPELGFARYVYAYACAGCDDAAEAISQFERYHRMEPESPLENVSYPRMGQALVRAGRWHDAIAAFEHGLRADHRISYAYCQLAVIRAHLGEADEARRQTRLTREFEPAATRELWVRRFGRLYVNSPLRSELVASLDRLWTETEPLA